MSWQAYAATILLGFIVGGLTVCLLGWWAGRTTVNWLYGDDWED